MLPAKYDCHSDRSNDKIWLFWRRIVLGNNCQLVNVPATLHCGICEWKNGSILL